MHFLSYACYLLVVVFGAGFALPAFAQDWQQQLILGLGNGGIYVESDAGRPILSHRAQEAFVPASTIKVATAGAALYYLSPRYRFITEFHIDSHDNLYIKGYGNPMLLSQELAQIAKELVQRKLRTVNNIILDDSYFDPALRVDGVERSSNPYDAVNAALLANFNTINVQKLKNGKILSGETQTPLTPVSLARAKPLRPGRHRVNLGFESRVAVQYVGELMLAFLQQEGATIQGGVKRGLVSEDAKLIYRHESSEDLEEALKGMLKFSTNLTANQLFLIMGAHKYGPPATVEKGEAAMRTFLKEQVGWQAVQVAEGSGLSRNTRVTCIQMMKLLRYMEPQREVFPLRDEVFRAKTGTLKDADTYAGYFPMPDGSYARFVILMNDLRTPHGQKFKLAKQLYMNLNGFSPTAQH